MRVDQSQQDPRIFTKFFHQIRNENFGKRNVNYFHVVYSSYLYINTDWEREKEE